MSVEFFRHSIGDVEKRAVAEVLDSVFLTTGNVTAEFEQRLAEYLGVPDSIGVMSCTHALEMALDGLKIGAGHEVITTPMTFIATANTVLRAGATPVFVDVEPATGLIDAAAVEAAITPRTRAILPVHLYGSMADMRGLRRIADAHGLAIVEDAAHCVEGIRDDVRPGQLGETACFSFYATKNITCGEGGAMTARTPEFAEWLRKARSHGMSKDAARRYEGAYQHWEMDFLGHKCNLNNIQAAMLLPQLERIESQLARREDIARRYEAAFAELDGVDFPRVPANSRSARHLFTIWVAPARRDAVLAGLQAEGIGVAVNYRAIHLLNYYREEHGYRRGQFPIAERIGDSTISLPLYPRMTDAMVDEVIAAVAKVAGAPTAV